MHKILVMNGINLNMFGQRDPKQYGTITLAQINEKLAAEGKKLGAELAFFQSNFEGEFVEKIHAAPRTAPTASWSTRVPGPTTATALWTPWPF